MRRIALTVLGALPAAAFSCGALCAGEADPHAEIVRLTAENEKLTVDRKVLTARLALYDKAVRDMEQRARALAESASAEVKRLNARIDDLKKEVSRLEADKEELRKQVCIY